ncbi:flagellar biosynthesis anti-sigma factor FlgM [Ramlibacter alkalitolerans]
MKIGTNLDTAALADAALRTTPPAAPASAVPAATDRIDVSAAGAQMSGLVSADFDQEKVDAIRQAIREGRFQVNAGAIADRLIADAAALLAPRSTQ